MDASAGKGDRAGPAQGQRAESLLDAASTSASRRAGLKRPAAESSMRLQLSRRCGMNSVLTRPSRFTHSSIIPPIQQSPPPSFKLGAPVYELKTRSTPSHSRGCGGRRRRGRRTPCARACRRRTGRPFLRASRLWHRRLGRRRARARGGSFPGRSAPAP